MDEDDRRVRRLRDAQDTRHRLGFEVVGARERVGGHLRALARRLERGDLRVDDARVLAVEAADAAALSERRQSLVELPVGQHHGGVGEVHLERRDAGGKHVVQLALDVLVPVVDGHVVAVVAPALAVGLLVPELEAVGKRLALVRAGEVDDARRAAADRRACAAVEVVRRGGVRHVEVEVRMRVDEAGEEVAVVHVDDLGIPRRVPHDVADLGDLAVFNEHVGAAGGFPADDEAAAQDGFHRTSLLCL